MDVIPRTGSFQPLPVGRRDLPRGLRHHGPRRMPARVSGLQVPVSTRVWSAPTTRVHRRRRRRMSDRAPADRAPKRSLEAGTPAKTLPPGTRLPGHGRQGHRNERRGMDCFADRIGDHPATGPSPCGAAMTRWLGCAGRARPSPRHRRAARSIRAAHPPMGSPADAQSNRRCLAESRWQTGPGTCRSARRSPPRCPDLGTPPGMRSASPLADA
jgi:hypothetical protein